jgi:predicted transcriptional regulator of viral defense system
MADRSAAHRALHVIAYRQAGYFTAEQARRAGFSYQVQKHHVDRGNWFRVDRGIFRLPDWPATIEDVYVRWSLWSGGRGVVSHQTALAVHGLGALDAARIHLTVPPGFRARDEAVVTHVGALPEDDVVARAGYRVTSVPRTILDVAQVMALQEPVDDAVADAVAQGLVMASELRRRADAFGEGAALRIERALAAVE